MDLAFVRLELELRILRHWADVEFAAEQEQRLFERLFVLLRRRAVVLEPRIALEAHQSVGVQVADKECDITVLFVLPSVELGLCHLCVVDKRHEFPLAEIDSTLWHVDRQMNDCDFIVGRRECLVGHQGVVNNPLLPYWRLRVLWRLLVCLCF